MSFNAKILTVIEIKDRIFLFIKQCEGFYQIQNCLYFILMNIPSRKYVLLLEKAYFTYDCSVLFVTDRLQAC